MSLQGKRQLDARLNAIGDTRALLRNIQRHGVRYAQLGAPHKTGNLIRTIRVGTLTPTSASIVAGGTRDVGYAGDVERGTRPHLIQPKAGRIGRNGRPAALAWGGKRRLTGSLAKGSKPTHFARSVRHPGTKAHPFLVPGLRKAAEEESVVGIVQLWNGAA